LFFGRCITGLGVGIGIIIGPLLLSELTPSSMRGMLVSSTELVTNLGIVLGFIIGYFLSGLNDGYNWRIMIGIGIIPPIFIIFFLPLIPESARWLII